MVTMISMISRAALALGQIIFVLLALVLIIKILSLQGNATQLT